MDTSYPYYFSFAILVRFLDVADMFGRGGHVKIQET